MVERISLLRNVGQFDNIAPNQHGLSKLSLIYAENGRGKTTLSNILRSLGDNNPALIEERHRLGSQHRPHIVVQANNQTFTYQNGAWQSFLPEIAVFDDNFVTKNVCSGIEVEPEHRQNLHELIIGAQGVALNALLQAEIVKIEEHNRVLREKEAAIPASMRGPLTVDAFCKLKQHADIDNAVQEVQRNLDAARSSDAIKQQPYFQSIELPTFDVDAIQKVLLSDLPELQQEAVAQAQGHFAKLGKDSEIWVGEGMNKVSTASYGEVNEICPFCAQDLSGSTLIKHYQGYFSEGYAALKKSVIDLGKSIASAHHADIQTAFERSVQLARENVAFWQRFIDVSPFDIDTEEVARTWKTVREPILSILRAKVSAPLEKMFLSQEILDAVSEYKICVQAVAALSQSLQGLNAQISVVKERSAGANVATLNSDLTNLKMIQLRYSPSVTPLCKAYQDEKDAKKATEKRRDQARQTLDAYRLSIFQTYQNAINDYLRRFLAGFRLQSMTSQNTRGGTSCTYNVLINAFPVPIASDSGPSFKNTLSAGDRNTLALAFFFASLDKDTDIAQKIVIIDDPMTSLDEHRSLATINEIIGLTSRVKQVIVLSHSKYFLCQLWNDAERAIKGTPRSVLQIIRTGDSSSAIELWNIHQDCITEHDKRHKLIANYIERCDPTKQREVASALRPTLEAFLRVAYPSYFLPETLLGTFLNQCTQKLAAGTPILSQEDVNELTELTNYANKFHHDSNPAYATEVINDHTLTDYARRTLSFARRA
ncbi:MAG: hypothetical protein EOM37_05360 [Proteobacteria bacterium]|nr:hypothetical protein [Pseudomonadota bacterium]